MYKLKGEKVANLTVLERNGSDVKKNVLWLCRCDCGTKVVMVGNYLVKKKKGYFQCSNKVCNFNASQRNNAHGFRKARGTKKGDFYSRWCGMKNRCDNPNFKDYHVYGGRGIKYSKSWGSFLNFYEDMWGSFEDNLTLERIDSNGDYCKENCTWIPMSEQGKNTNRCIYATYKGKKLTLADIARDVGMGSSSFYRRYKYFKGNLDIVIKTKDEFHYKRKYDNDGKLVNMI